MVSNAERDVVMNAMARGARIIAYPSIVMSNNGAKNSSKNPFRINDPKPKVKTKNGINILVSNGQNRELIILMKITNNIMSSKLFTLTPRPKKLIRYIPKTFPIKIIKLLFNVVLGGVLESLFAI